MNLFSNLKFLFLPNENYWNYKKKKKTDIKKRINIKPVYILAVTNA